MEQSGTAKDPLFEGDYSSIVTTLIFISKHTRAFLNIRFRDIGIEVGQDQFIQALPIDGSMSVGSIADMIGVRASTVSKMADRLVEGGLVQRVVDAKDARKTQIVLTPEGIRKRAHIETLVRKLEEELIVGLGTNANEIAEALSRIDTALSKRLKRLR